MGFPSPSPSALSSSLLARALLLPPRSPDAYSDGTGSAGANAAAVEVSVSAPASAPAVAVTVGLAIPHAAHLRFLDALCRVHLVQAQPGPGPRCFDRLVMSEAADPAAPLLLVGEGAPLSATALCLFLLLVVDADPGTVGSMLLLLPPVLVVSAARRLEDDDTEGGPPPPPASCSLLAYAASLDVLWRTWRRPLIYLAGRLLSSY